jgi:hypothetical protein
MKKLNSWKDISIKWDDDRAKFIVNLRPLYDNYTPSELKDIQRDGGRIIYRPSFASKSEAVVHAQEAWENYINPDAASRHERSTIDDITVQAALALYLEAGCERAANPDEKFGYGSLANYETHVNRLKTIQVKAACGEGAILFQDYTFSSINKFVIEEVWKELRQMMPSFRTADDTWQSLSRCFQLAFKREYITSNPCLLCERSRPDDQAQRIKKIISSVAKVSFETLQKIVEHTPDEISLKSSLLPVRDYAKPRPLPLKSIIRSRHSKAGSILLVIEFMCAKR